ncbi:unnamed protein product, partial [Chrysoparadoxa australica]
GVAEAEVSHERVVSRRLQRVRAELALRRGEPDQAVSECRQLVAEHLMDHAKDQDYVSVLQLMASVMRDQCLAETQQEKVKALLEECQELLIGGETVLLDLA